MSPGDIEEMLRAAARRADEWFPEGAFPGIVERARAGRLAAALASLGESPLRWAPGVIAIDRLLVVPTFGGGPVAVVASRRGEGWWVRGVAALVGGEPTGIAPCVERALAGPLSSRYLAAREALDLHGGYAPSARDGHDGAEWLLESIDHQRHRVIREWSPRGRVLALGACLLEACGYQHVLGPR